MPGMQQVEHAVGEDDRLPRRAEPGDERHGLLAREHARLAGTFDLHGLSGAPVRVNVIASENRHACFGR